MLWARLSSYKPEVISWAGRPNDLCPFYLMGATRVEDGGSVLASISSQGFFL